MKDRNWPYWALVAIAIITIVSGFVQMIRPSFVLGIVGGETIASNQHSFGIVGMFMVLFGGMLLHALLSATDHPIVVFWASFQKFGASLAVGVGVLSHIFSPLALWVAGFDLFSGMLGIRYWLSIRK